MNMNESIQTGLQQVLADTYSLMAKTHLYHWNVTGSNFMSLHTQFQTQYEALFAAADEIAERIRQLGSMVSGGLPAFTQASNISVPQAITGEAMLKELAEDHKTMSASLVSFANLADKAKDRITADLLTARAADHDKTAWMLAAQVSQHR
jgi:starvation-inducible DNA-binding protein